MRVLIVTKIFPNRIEPGSAPFNRQQFSLLNRFCDVEVLATIPWFPGASWFGKWSSVAKLARVPGRETIDGLSVRHPRTLFVPRIAPGWSGPLYAASLARQMLAYRGRVDVVLGSWAYPDGYAAIRLAQMLRVPAVVKLHGSDINVVAQMPAPARRLRQLLPRAARIVAVSRQLGQAVTALGVSPEKVSVVPNGVDTALFHARPRRDARRTLGLDLDERIILYVGRLEREKGVFDLLDAFEQMPIENRPRLVLLGDGKARAECEARAARFGGKLKLLGARPLPEVPRWLAACDVACLPSWNEGMPNAVLEALACGRRVVGTRVGAIPDLLPTATLGEVVERKSPSDLRSALLRAAAYDYDPAAVVAAAAVGSWEDSARGLHESLRKALGTTDLAPRSGLHERPGPSVEKAA